MIGISHFRKYWASVAESVSALCRSLPRHHVGEPADTGELLRQDAEQLTSLAPAPVRRYRWRTAPFGRPRKELAGAIESVFELLSFRIDLDRACPALARGVPLVSAFMM